MCGRWGRQVEALDGLEVGVGGQEVFETGGVLVGVGHFLWCGVWYGVWCGIVRYSVSGVTKRVNCCDV